MLEYYILDENKQPKQVSLLEWSQWFTSSNPQLLFFENENASVSGAFIGVGHNVMFELYIINGSRETIVRFDTYEQLKEAFDKEVASL